MSTPPSNITAPEHWAEWFEKCALVRCSDETRRALGIFAYERYEDYLLKALGQGKSKSDLPIDARDLLYLNSPGACWYDLEDSYWVRQTPGDKSGKESDSGGAKTYKKYYLEEASKKGPEGGRNWLEAKTSKNLMWTRCRSIILKARKFRSDSRDDEATDESHKSPQGEDLLVAYEVQQRAGDIFGLLTTEERILILAKANNITLADPEICSRLGLSKSVLYQRQKTATNRIAPQLLRDNLDAEDVPLILSHLLNHLTQWALSPECGIGDCLTRGEANT